MPFLPALIDDQWADPVTVPANGSWTSAVIRNRMHFDRIVVGLTSTQAGQVTITQYVDPNGQVKLAATSASLTASTAATVSDTAGVPFESFTVTITNTAGSAATISNFAGLLRQ